MKTLIPGLLLSTILLAQPQASISVVGNVPRLLTLTTEDLAKMPRARIVAYEGVWLHEILTKAGLEAGSDKVGYIVASASDGYRAVFSLGEADPTVTETQILVADKVNGQALTGRDGSFRLVVPGDIRGVRSVRQLTRIEVVLLPPAQR
jgi:DMSO/TMAO reductase YedYZ molybdopterin-dependent catalytic subunit